MAKLETYYATGRRKTAVAKVWLRPGNGRILVNYKEPEKYFQRITLCARIKQPLEAIGGLKGYDVISEVKGGGKSAQADAMRLGIARSLLALNPDLQPLLRKGGFLTRDPREKERKKYGQPGARKRFQWTKR